MHVFKWVFLRDRYCIGGIGFQSASPQEGAGVLNVPEDDCPRTWNELW